MNIFKVLASGKKSFQEETASAILSWFLNPVMEHGLGFLFLSRFIDSLFTSVDLQNIAANPSHKLTARLRFDDENQLNFWSNLEYNVETAFIDIVIGIDDWIFAIENKIYSASTTAGQLVREYDGLKTKLQNTKTVAKIGMIYLVPINEGAELLDQKTWEVYKELNVTDNDTKFLITWQKNELDNVPSISQLIETILQDEATGRIDPIPEYTRHTLKALNCFISSNFTGYEYTRKASTTSQNPMTEERLSVTELLQKDKGFIGVNNGIGGLIRLETEILSKQTFQYTTQDMTRKNNWLDIQTFKNLCNWLLNNQLPEIKWEGNYNAKVLYKIAKSYKEKVYIGIKGGEPALKAMTKEQIEAKSWGIGMEKVTNNWIDGSVFCEIIDSLKENLSFEEN